MVITNEPLLEYNAQEFFIIYVQIIIFSSHNNDRVKRLLKFYLKCVVQFSKINFKMSRSNENYDYLFKYIVVGDVGK